MLNEAQEYSLFSNSNKYLIPPEIPTEIHQLPYGYTSGILYFQFEKKSIVDNNHKKDKLLGLIPVVIFFLIITIETRAYLFCHILPMLEYHKNLTFAF